MHTARLSYEQLSNSWKTVPMANMLLWYSDQIFQAISIFSIINIVWQTFSLNAAYAIVRWEMHLL